MTVRNPLPLLPMFVTLCICLVVPSTGYTENGFVAASLSLPVKRSKSSGKNEAAEQAQRQYGGKVLSVKKHNSSGRAIYKVKLLLDNGRIKIVDVK